MNSSVHCLIPLLMIMASISTFVSCHNSNSIKSESNVCQETIFFGDSTLTVIATNEPNGYDVKIFKSVDIMLMNLKRGDSINQFVPIVYFPDFDGEECSEELFGTIYRKINIPIEKEALGTGIFFMDVNFDGEEELLIEYPGYNRRYFACFDLLHGNTSVVPGILTPMDEPPYNNIVGPVYAEAGEISTEFDYKNKTIHILEQIGCCSHYETWAEYGKDDEWETSSVRVIRQERVDYTADGRMIIEIYERKDGELKLVSSKEEEI